jgi:ATP-dependent HslUV protease ATP-binding subunit HslU
MANLTPRDIVAELDKHIVGQGVAKRAVATALRNRWRRLQVPGTMRAEITPKNILMIGPTGVGKTEIARRLARLANAPFIKVEATKFTEVGYVGREVDSIIKDLMDIAIKLTRDEEMQKVQAAAQSAAEERLLDTLLPRSSWSGQEHTPQISPADVETRTRFRRMLLEGTLNEQEIEIEIRQQRSHVEIIAPPGMEEMSAQLQSMFQSLGQGSGQVRKLKVRDALKRLVDEEAAKLTNEEQIRQRAVENAERNGIVFIDEIDKIVGADGSQGAGISREGVQRDLLPLVEGCTVNTRYGAVKTDHILFIASGAFHAVKASDLIPELQGRFPIRVELENLTAADFVRILNEPDASLTKQYQALLLTEGTTLTFAPDAIEAIARAAHHVNENTENIGARRLHAILEQLLGDISFNAADGSLAELKIDRAYVQARLGALTKDQDLSRYIL